MMEVLCAFVYAGPYKSGTSLEGVVCKTNKQKNNTSQCGSCFHGVWGDPDLGTLTSIGIPAHRGVVCDFVFCNTPPPAASRGEK